MHAVRLFPCDGESCFGLKCEEAWTKSDEMTAWSRDHHAEASESDMKLYLQDEVIPQHLMQLLPDKAYKMVNETEPDKEVLIKDVHFFIEFAMLCYEQSKRLQKIRVIPSLELQAKFLELDTKYGFNSEAAPKKRFACKSPMTFLFPIEQYKIVLEKPYLARDLPDAFLEHYPNFKVEYHIEGIMALLPPDKNLGGFVKGCLAVEMTRRREIYFGRDRPPISLQLLQIDLAWHRIEYHSTIYSTEERLEFFEKLNLKEEDLAVWAARFDEEVPEWNKVHILFDQKK